MSAKLDQIESFSSKEEDLAIAKRKFLESYGWKYSSSIASIWLHQKEVDGVLIAVDTDTALFIEERL